MQAKKDNDIKKVLLMILLILLIGLLLRVIFLNQSFWLDEAITAQTIQNYNLVSIITDYIPYDFHPAGHYQLLWLWSHIFGTSEISLRMPSVVFSLFTVYMVYKIGQLLTTQKLALFASLIMAVNPLSIYYAQEARMYSMAMFGVSLSFYFFIKIAKQKYLTFDLIGYGLALIIILSSDYVAYLAVLPQIFLILVSKSIRIKKDYIKAIFIPFLAGLVWLIIFFQQLRQGLAIANNVEGWKSVVGGFGIKPMVLTFIKFIIGRISMQNKTFYYLTLIPILTFCTWIILQARQLILWLWLLVPIITAMAISYFVPIYDYFRMIFVLPAFILLLVCALEKYSKRKTYLFLTLILSVQIFSTLLYLFNPQFHREDWKGLVGFLSNNTVKPILIEGDEEFAPLLYYKSQNINILPALKQVPVRKNDDLMDLPVANSIILLDYLVEITDPNRLLRRRLEQSGYILVKTYNFRGVGFVYEYHKP